MEKTKIEFVQPKRRLTRQRSGFNVGGIQSGSECQILPTQRIKISSKTITLKHTEENVILSKLFGEDIGLYGAGGYFKSNKKVTLNIHISLLKDGAIIKESRKSIRVESSHWIKIGDDVQIEIPHDAEVYTAVVEIQCVSKESSFILEFLGLCAGSVIFYAEKPDYKKTYYEKTELYKPDIYYLDSVDFEYDDTNTQVLNPGYMVCKSCNRCARFLPIDIENEKNALGFSNHCKKRAPCTHNAFSKYRVENGDGIQLLPSELQKSLIENNGNKCVSTHFGFQLECRTCKKFVVNAPLNPLRNKAQHHEDGSRRRAFERLIIEMTGIDTVKNFRFQNVLEYQNHIWEKFSRKCFGCGKDLKEITDMDIDHTLPLVYLWPLDETATALCKTCNSAKHELFPGEFKRYEGRLSQLSKLTGIPLVVLSSKERVVNKDVADKLVDNVVWLFDEFLSREEYQKVKNGKKSADLIYKALNKILTTINIDLVAQYKLKTNSLPTSVTLG